MKGAQAINTRFVSGTAWMLALRWSMRFIGLFSTIILARLLTPQDFGLVAMALVVLAIADSATSLGVDLALIRHEGDATHLYNAAWTLRILQNLGLAILLLIAAPFAVDYFHESRLEGIFRIYALRYVLLGFANIGPVEFRKNLEFSREYRFLLTKKFVGFFLTVGLAIWLRDYRAIVYATLAKTIFGVCYSYVIHPYRPRLSTSGMKSILGFSQWVLVARLGGTLNEKGAQLIAGAAVSASTLGLYHISVELATMFINEVVMPARRSLIPNLSKSLGNRQQFIHHSIISLSILGIVCIPIGVGVNIVALELVELLFGPRWVDAVPLVELLALLGIFLGTKLALTMILLVAGDAKKNAVLDWLEVLILIPLLTYVGSSGDIEAIAITRTVVAGAMIPVTILFVCHTLDVSYFRLAGAYWRPVVAATCMYVVSKLFPVMDNDTYILKLITDVALGFFSYVLILLFLWRLSGKPASGERYLLALAAAGYHRLREKR